MAVEWGDEFYSVADFAWPDERFDILRKINGKKFLACECMRQYCTLNMNAYSEFMRLWVCALHIGVSGVQI